VAAENDAVSVELPGAAWSRRHSRDGFDSPSRSRSHPDTRKGSVLGGPGFARPFGLRSPWQEV